MYTKYIFLWGYEVPSGNQIWTMTLTMSIVVLKLHGYKWTSQRIAMFDYRRVMKHYGSFEHICAMIVFTIPFISYEYSICNSYSIAMTISTGNIWSNHDLRLRLRLPLPGHLQLLVGRLQPVLEVDSHLVPVLITHWKYEIWESTATQLNQK